jgi:intracellular septation protein A
MEVGEHRREGYCRAMADADEGRAPNPSIADAIGGPVGLVESALPAVAFVVAYSASGQDTTTAAAIAVAIALALTLGRLVRRESPQQAISGLVGVAFAAFIATRSGKAENFFLPGLLANVAYASAFLVSIVIRRPLVGYIVGAIDGERGWRENPARLRVFMRASWLWVVLFLVRLAVQLPLYIASAVVALGVARTAMGLPLFGLGLWLTYRLVRRGAQPQPAGPPASSP